MKTIALNASTVVLKQPKQPYTTSNTTLMAWFERDRAHVALVDKATEQVTILEWWDDAVFEAMSDGFIPHRAFFMGKLIRPHELHLALVELANEGEGL